MWHTTDKQSLVLNAHTYPHLCVLAWRRANCTTGYTSIRVYVGVRFNRSTTYRFC